MKYKIIAMIIIMAFIVSCDGPTPDDRPQQLQPTEEKLQPTEEKWNSWLKGKIGFEVLSAIDSAKWLKEHQSKISMPANLSFTEEHIVVEQPFRNKFTTITVDHNGKYRVLAIGGFIYGLDPLDDYLDEKESKQWLTDNDYQLSKDTDGGFILQKQRPGFSMNRKLGGTIIGMSLENGVTLSLIDGKIRIKIKKD